MWKCIPHPVFIVIWRFYPISENQGFFPTMAGNQMGTIDRSAYAGRKGFLRRLRRIPFDLMMLRSSGQGNVFLLQRRKGG
jgi:hypothetical protein